MSNLNRENFLNITKIEKWKSEAQKLLKKASFDEDFIREFHTHWTEAGHRIRTQIGNDQDLVNLLSAILPKYTGPNIKLYRGENLNRWNAAQTGLCWTSCIKTAKMFAGGLNAVESGGVLLEADCPSEAVISGPSNHSNYLGESEYTVNRFKLRSIKVLENFPATSIVQ